MTLFQCNPCSSFVSLCAGHYSLSSAFNTPPANFLKKSNYDCNAGMNYLKVANFLRASVSPAKHLPER
jgi:hypothetical protein